MKERFARTVRLDGSIFINGERYYAGKLTNRSGKLVLVEADSENFEQVDVYTIGGKKLICTAMKVKKHQFKGGENEKPTA